MNIEIDFVKTSRGSLIGVVSSFKQGWDEAFIAEFGDGTFMQFLQGRKDGEFRVEYHDGKELYEFLHDIDGERAVSFLTLYFNGEFEISAGESWDKVNLHKPWWKFWQ